MYLIKKYANRKLYDTIEKKYITMKALTQIIKSGKDVKVIENKTGEDITASIVSNLIVDRNDETERPISSGMLFQLIRKGGGALTDYKKKYTSFWQETFTMAEDEVDKLVKQLIKNKEISKSEGGRLKSEITGFTVSVKKMIGEIIDKKMNDVLSGINLTTKNQVTQLEERISILEKKLAELEQEKTKI